MKQWVAEVIRSPQRVAIPIMTHPGIEYTGQSVKEAVTDGHVHFKAILALEERFPAAACTTIMDLTVEAEAFGAEVIFPENEIPTVASRLVYDQASVEQLQIPDLSKGRIPQFLLANELAAEYITDKPVLGGCIGPFSLAGRLYDLSEFMMACYCEPETAQTLLSKCAEFLQQYCLEMKKQGIQGVIIAEPAAGLLSDEGCREFSSDYIRSIVEAVQDEHFIVILHNCGNTGHCTEAMLHTGAVGYHFGNNMDINLALGQCPSDVLVLGNLDPVGLFMGASAGEMETAVTHILGQTSNHPNFVLSSGCDVPPHIPQANIEAFYQALHFYNENSFT